MISGPSENCRYRIGLACHSRDVAKETVPKQGRREQERQTLIFLLRVVTLVGQTQQGRGQRDRVI
jgi:hypothetical protein